jgi:hypothetical protein
MTVSRLWGSAQAGGGSPHFRNSIMKKFFLGLGTIIGMLSGWGLALLYFYVDYLKIIVPNGFVGVLLSFFPLTFFYVAFEMLFVPATYLFILMITIGGFCIYKNNGE